jgi:hypothetical protein
MPTITLKVPRDLAKKLEIVSAQKRVSKSTFMRNALKKELERTKVKPSLYDLMKDRIGKFGSGKTDLATNPKHMEGFGRWRR